MGEEFYSIIKLISGEEIFSLISIVDNNGEPIAILQNPLVMKIVQSPKGGFIKVRRWIELSTEDIFMMRMDRILTMSECTDDKLIQIYNNYVETEDDDPEIGIFKPTGKVRPDSKMGYIASVEDARKKFDVLFKINQEPKES